MNVHDITARHLQRLAYLYVRQSTLQQVLENRESTARQYALRERAIALGWSPDHVVVLDQDLGHSGASAVDRVAFQRLVADVGLAKVGLVLGLEVSRLARSSSEWHHLLEICALTRTLILDEDGLYDPALFNDRLLLGLKGTMSEAELYVLRARLHGGIVNKARRAELKLNLPIGFCYTETDQIVLDPDRQVQDTVRYLFATFRRTGSASATVRVFRDEHLAFPRRLTYGAHQGDVLWNTLQHHDVLRVLHNPGYTGAFVFGRTQTTKTADGKVHIIDLPRAEWQVLVRDAHVGYIPWDDYEANLAQLAANRQAYAPARLSPPREGPALLQGLILCGRCGNRMTVRYHQRGGQRIIPDYVCQRAGIEHGEAPCQRILGRDLDAAIDAVVVETATPQMVAQTLAIHDSLVARTQEAERLRQMHVERARYEADLAQRRYLRVDPENRLVADVLEADWNDKLRVLTTVREHMEQQRQTVQTPVSAGERETMVSVMAQFSRFWSDPQTAVRDRKRIIRLLIADVTVIKAETITAHIRFTGGATRSLTVSLPPPFAQSRLTDVQTLRAIDHFLDEYPDNAVAAQLNAAGYHTFAGLPFTALHVSGLRHAHGLKDYCARLRERGLLTAEELALQLKVSTVTVYRWYHANLVQGVRYDERGTCLFYPPDTPPVRQRRKRATKLCGN